MTTLRNVVTEIFDLHESETQFRCRNLEYIEYLQRHFTAESTDLSFVKWLDVGIESLKNWDETINYLNKKFVCVSVSDFVHKIETTDVVDDLDVWIFNYQNYRSYFADSLIDDVICRFEQLFLRLSSILLKYKKLQNNLG